MKNNHVVIICVESVFIEDLIVAFVSAKAFSRQRSGTKHNKAIRPVSTEKPAQSKASGLCQTYKV